MTDQIKEGRIDDRYKITYNDVTSATVHYVAWLTIEGHWAIMKSDTSTPIESYLWAKGTTGFAAAWTGRAGLTYTTYDLA